ncbi:aldehyde dehydrogenase family protein [Rhodopila sp.]|uniref:aldehyde dehydrogenase family protein n=1 Tax=Rhodopila sp. TaxID=2480087 RepID=UPI003D125052
MDGIVIGTAADVASALRTARAAAAAWRGTQLRDRLLVIRRTRHLLAARAVAIAATLDGCRPIADTLTAEILPLLAGARFLEQRATAILAPHRLRARRPLWLLGVAAEIRREPCGVVLVLAPSNYPLFLPGAQILQALVAGNAVCAKPAPGCAEPLRALSGLLTEAGLPDGLLQVLDESAGTPAAGAGFDRIVLTGSAETGRRVLAAASETLTPTTMELSGNDPVLVLPNADLKAVADALSYGLRLNGGATCIAPRRIFVSHPQAAALEHALQARIMMIKPARIPHRVAVRLDALVAEAVGQGARLLSGKARAGHVSPTILADATPAMRLLQQDVFAPWLAIVPVAGMAQALDALAACPYALGAAVFGPEREARALAEQIPAGSVCINDLIVPTADPRLPFGGRGQSGFGVTRGAEGLLEMTVIKTISTRRGRFRPHLAAPQAGDVARYAGLIELLYGRPAHLLSALRRLVGRSRR